MTTPRLRFAARRCASASFIVRCEGSGPARRCGGKSNGKRYRRQKRPTAQALPQHIVVGDASRAAERYARAFGARERSRVPLPGGSLLVIRVDRAEALDAARHWTTRSPRSWRNTASPLSRSPRPPRRRRTDSGVWISGQDQQHVDHGSDRLPAGYAQSRSARAESCGWCRRPELLTRIAPLGHALRRPRHGGVATRCR